MSVNLVHFALSRATASAGPNVEPIGLEEAKLHIRETDSAQNGIVAELIAAAREDGEQRSGRAWITQRWNLKLDAFPDCDGPILVPMPPLQSVVHIKYIATDGTLTTLSTSAYTVDAHSEPGRVLPAFGYYWPATRDVPNAVTVLFTAGYGDGAEDVPRRLRQAALMTVGHWYENRESSIVGTIISEVPHSADAIYKSMRPYRFG